MLDLVTVCYEPELPMLGLQARSLDRFLSPDLVGRIVVVDNTRRGLSSRQRRRLGHDYGGLRDRVQFRRPAELVDPAVLDGLRTSGWRLQQVLKLRAAAELTGSLCIVLDAKNHLVHDVDLGFFRDDDGHDRTRAYDLHGHPHLPSFEQTLRYLGLDPAQHVGRFTPTVTPFPLRPDLVRALLDDVAGRSERGFEREFVDHRLTEFFLYSGWLLSTGRALEDVFAFGQPDSPTVWPGAADAAGVRRQIERSLAGSLPFFAVHRSALVRLDRAARAALCGFWAERGLYSSPARARAGLRRMRVAAALAAVRGRWARRATSHR
ncbi:DUF6492 family protein [Angustibacter luteus]|uniref:DUF6492 family protein n=1 Tax=Angustibacter luteus TaxID=658456 RepID=A0ABW1JB11_9ACTN